MIQIIYWITLGLTVYTFLLYPVLLAVLRKRWRMTPVVQMEGNVPFVSLIIVAYNEEKVIQQKLDNCLALDYPRERMQVIVVSDGSTDGTEEIVKRYEGKGVELCVSLKRGGKTNAQNQAVLQARNEILCFSDANSMWRRDALKNLVVPFSDSRVAYACGRLFYQPSEENHTRQSEGLYWRYELLLRKWESEIYSVTGGNGAIYAVRKKEFMEIDPFYSHDFYFPQLMVKKGKLAVYIEDAVAEEQAGGHPKDEFARRVRMFGRTWLGLFREPHMFSFFRQPLVYAIMLLSHRFLRYTLPFLLLTIFLSNGVLVGGGGWYFFSFIMQLLFYLLALLGVLGCKGTLFFIPLYLSMFAAASLVGLLRFALGQVKPYWEQAESTRE